MTELRGRGPNGWGIYTFTDRPILLAEGEEAVVKSDAPLLLRGFVDGHIHGAYGVDVMSASPEELARLDQRLREEAGYDAWIPTTVTASCDDVRRMIDRLPECPSIAGFHLEGPFLSPKHPGAQPAAFLTEYPGEGTPWDEVLDHPRLRVVTLAPEIPGGLELTRRMVARGVIVSLGHTDATAEQTQAALDAGATRITHTFNAMRPFHHREVGVVGKVLGGKVLGGATVTAELIYDRLHVSPDAAALLLDRADVALVSDGTMATGLPGGTELTMWGLPCRVGNGAVRLAEGGALAGSTITLADAFTNAVEDFGALRAIWAAESGRLSLGLSPTFGGWIAFDPRGRTLQRLSATHGGA